MMLAGLKVVEMGQNLAGPYGAQILADLGAEVIKVERPSGDDSRGWGTRVTNLIPKNDVRLLDSPGGC